MSVSRRHLLGASMAAALGAAGVAVSRQGKRKGEANHLRPPGALDEDAFTKACSRCFKCGNACPNGCIQYHEAEAGPRRAFTPYIKARERGCTLCGECANVCPSGALQPFEVSREGWLAGVDMGMARVNESLCYSFHGRTCGACYRACPLAGQAIKIGMFETPHIDMTQCVGCGLCEQACLHLPQAIRVIPREHLSARMQANRKQVAQEVTPPKEQPA